MFSSTFDNLCPPPRGREPSVDQFCETVQPMSATVLTDEDASAGSNMPISQNHLHTFEQALEPGVEQGTNDYLEDALGRVLQDRRLNFSNFSDDDKSGIDELEQELNEADATYMSDEDHSSRAVCPVSEAHSRQSPPEPPTKLARTHSDRIEIPAEWEIPKRALRERTVSQKHPYKVEREMHERKRRSGQDPDASEVEEAVIKSTQVRVKGCKRKSGDANSLEPEEPINAKSRSKSRSRASKSPAKERKRSNARSNVKARKPSVESTISVIKRSTSPLASLGLGKCPSPTPESVYTAQGMIEKTTLFTYLKDHEGSAPIPLVDCPTLDMLIAFIKDHWVEYKGGSFDSIQCTLPWKKDNRTILIREGWSHSFDQMMKEIQNAPAWRKKSGGALEVKMRVILA